MICYCHRCDWRYYPTDFPDGPGPIRALLHHCWTWHPEAMQ